MAKDGAQHTARLISEMPAKKRGLLSIKVGQADSAARQAERRCETLSFVWVQVESGQTGNGHGQHGCLFLQTDHGGRRLVQKGTKLHLMVAFQKDVEEPRRQGQGCCRNTDGTVEAMDGADLCSLPLSLCGLSLYTV